MQTWEKWQIPFDKKSQYFAWGLGSRTNPAVIFLPGFSGDHRDFQAVGAVLSESYRVIILDYPGWGESGVSGQPATVAHYAEFVRATLETLGVDKATVVGHCLGAGVAVTLTARYPERVKGLVLVSAPYAGGSLLSRVFVGLTGLARYSPKFLRPLFFLWRNRLLLIFLDLLLLKYPKFSQTLGRIVYDLRERPRQQEDVIEANWLSQISFDWRSLSGFKCPLHFVHGARDLLVPVNQAKQLGQFAPVASWEILPDAGHNPQLEAPESLALAIGKCLLVK